MAVAVEGATVVREHQGFYYNVLVYKQRCDDCEYRAPTNSFAVAPSPWMPTILEAFPVLLVTTTKR